MKRNLLALIFTLILPWSVQAEDTYHLDVQQSKIEWSGKKVTGQHNGTVGLKTGRVLLDGQKITGGNFTIDMKTIEVADIKDPAPNQKLKDHFFSDDFFSVEKYPESQFKITSVKDLGGNKIEVTGDLTLKGISKPITFPADLNFQNNAVLAQGKAKLDRTQWNIRYGSGKFFQGLGDKLIDDEIELQLKLVAKK